MTMNNMLRPRKQDWPKIFLELMTVALSDLNEDIQMEIGKSLATRWLKYPLKILYMLLFGFGHPYSQ